jgi:hypothetical protein
MKERERDRKKKRKREREIERKREREREREKGKLPYVSAYHVKIESISCFFLFFCTFCVSNYTLCSLILLLL